VSATLPPGGGEDAVVDRCDAGWELDYEGSRWTVWRCPDCAAVTAVESRWDGRWVPRDPDGRDVAVEVS